MKSVRNICIISSLLLSTSALALSLGTIQKTKLNESPGISAVDYLAANQTVAQSVCSQQGLRLPTSSELLQIGSNPKNANELKNAAFWSSEKGTLLNGDYGWVADGYSWDELVAGVICL